MIAVVLIIAAVLSNMSLFKTTAGPGKLTAANIVKFMAFTAALAVLFIAAQRAALQLRREPAKARLLGELLVPLATFTVVASAHGVLLLVLKPFLNGDWRGVYNWLFVVACLGAAAWLVLSVLGPSGPLQRLTATTHPGEAAGPSDSQPGVSGRLCECGASVGVTAKYCVKCGMSV